MSIRLVNIFLDFCFNCLILLYRIKECVDEFEYKFKDSETGKIKKFKITEKSFCRGQALKPMEKEKYIYLQS